MKLKLLFILGLLLITFPLISSEIVVEKKGMFTDVIKYNESNSAPTSSFILNEEGIFRDKEKGKFKIKIANNANTQSGPISVNIYTNGKLRSYCQGECGYEDKPFKNGLAPNEVRIGADFMAMPSNNLKIGANNITFKVYEDGELVGQVTYEFKITEGDYPLLDLSISNLQYEYKSDGQLKFISADVTNNGPSKLQKDCINVDFKFYDGPLEHSYTSGSDISYGTRWWHYLIPGKFSMKSGKTGTVKIKEISYLPTGEYKLDYYIDTHNCLNFHRNINEENDLITTDINIK